MPTTHRYGHLALALVCAAALATLVACRSRRPVTSSSPGAISMAPSTPMPMAPTTQAPGAQAPMSAVGAQIQHGSQVYAATCARCHGAAGEGSATAPALVGPSALPMNPPPGRRLRRVQFRNAHDVGVFVLTNMPPRGPRLPPTEVAATLAWLLAQNGVPPTMVVSPTTAPSMRLH